MDEDVCADDDGSNRGPPLHDEESWLPTSVLDVTPTFPGVKFLQSPLFVLESP